MLPWCFHLPGLWVGGLGMCIPRMFWEVLWGCREQSGTGWRKPGFTPQLCSELCGPRRVLRPLWASVLQ